MSVTRTGRAVLVALLTMLLTATAGVAAGAPDTTSQTDLPRDAATAAAQPGAPLPACKIRDKLTRYHLGRQWRKTLLDTNLKLKRSYVPYGLTSVSSANIKGSGKVRKLVIADLKAMARAARRAGKPLAVRSAYRSYARQAEVFRAEVAIYGRTRALRQAARPGHSEHQMGTAIDFMSASSSTAPWLYDFGSSPAGKWIARNGWKYGFVLPYPKGKRNVSCYSYEPWHWRYVGRELARDIHESGMVPRRFYWRNFETAP